MFAEPTLDDFAHRLTCHVAQQKSLRNIFEGVIAGALTPTAVAAAVALSTALGT